LSINNNNKKKTIRNRAVRPLARPYRGAMRYEGSSANRFGPDSSNGPSVHLPRRCNDWRCKTSEYLVSTMNIFATMWMQTCAYSQVSTSTQPYTSSLLAFAFISTYLPWSLPVLAGHGTECPYTLVCFITTLWLILRVQMRQYWDYRKLQQGGSCIPGRPCHSRLPTAAARVQTQVWSCGGILWWTKVALGAGFLPENFGFPCKSTFNLLLHNHLYYHPRLAQ
jgi:hypothetical protein